MKTAVSAPKSMTNPGGGPEKRQLTTTSSSSASGGAGGSAGGRLNANKGGKQRHGSNKAAGQGSAGDEGGGAAAGHGGQNDSSMKHHQRGHRFGQQRGTARRTQNTHNGGNGHGEGVLGQNQHQQQPHYQYQQNYGNRKPKNGGRGNGSRPGQGRGGGWRGDGQPHAGRRYFFRGPGGHGGMLPHGGPSLMGPGGFGGPQFIPVYPVFAAVGPPVPQQGSPFAFDVTPVDSQASSDHAARVSEVHSTLRFDALPQLLDAYSACGRLLEVQARQMAVQMTNEKQRATEAWLQSRSTEEREQYLRTHPGQAPAAAPRPNAPDVAVL